jgi:predicted TIM-barrel fold metal-dependent hydrolase
VDIWLRRDSWLDIRRRPTRRQVLCGLGALGATACLPDAILRAQGPAAGNPRRLDLHHHFGSPRWIKRTAEVRRQGWEAFQGYSPAKVIEAMDMAGIATSFVSCTEPGIWFGDDFRIERHAAIELARDMNEYGARMMSEYKGRFGLFAVLPLPDIDASLKEIEYAFDTLRADGVGLLTSYGDMWLGDDRLRPVFDELNRRNAVVYTHPTDATCCHALLPGTSPGTLEWFTDTTRTILSLIQEPPGARSAGAPAASVATRYANVKFIWSHGGGTLVGTAARVVGGITAENLARTPPPNSRLHHVRRFYYDTAGAANPLVMQALKRVLGGTSQIVFGTDYPYGGAQMVDDVEALATVGFTPEELRGIDRTNALRILPKYAS